MNKKYIFIVLILLISMPFCYVLSSDHNSNHSDSIRVGMGDQRQIILPNDLSFNKKIFTDGLCGCIAIAMLVKCKSGVRHAMMSHYPPIQRDLQIKGLQRMLMGVCQGENDSIGKKDLIVLVPGEWFKDGEGKWTVWKANQTENNHILRLGACVGVEPVVSPYSTFKTIEKVKQKYFHDFELDLSNDKATWRSFGDSHILHKIEE
jgi:hypothetical protein